MTQAPKFADITVSVRSGSLMDSGRTELLIDLRAHEFGNSAPGVGSVFERGVGLREFEIDRAALGRLEVAMCATGLPTHVPDVTDDPGDVAVIRWARINLMVMDIDGASGSLSLTTPLAFAGEDAPALRAFFSTLLEVAGVGSDDLWWLLAGRDVPRDLSPG